MVFSENFSFLEVLQGCHPFLGVEQVLAEEAKGHLIDLEELLLELEHLGGDPLLGEGDAVFFSQVLQGLGKVQILLFHDQREDVPADTAAEAVEELLFLVDRE